MLVLQTLGCWEKLHFFICLRQTEWWLSSHISGLAGKLTLLILRGGLLFTSAGIVHESQRLKSTPKEVSCRWFLCLFDQALSAFPKAGSFAPDSLPPISPSPLPSQEAMTIFTIAPMPGAPGITRCSSPQVWVPLGHCVEAECRSVGDTLY